jgi:hypothetical protein
MAKRSSRLTGLLTIRWLARALAPVVVIWAIVDWWRIDWKLGVGFGLLTGNYVLVYILGSIAPPLMVGPWRIRPWQTFILLLNTIALPIAHYSALGSVPWGFVIISVLFLVGLYASTMILFYINEKLPMAGLFAARRAGILPGRPADGPKPAPSSSAA